ncbi:D-alanine--D-alanine ligase [uncultured archaeon]|nr:D-alanine--D-alanine ligase [uncultured archaeon]
MKQIIKKIGFPVVIKPNHGFGAIGVRYANSLEEFEDVYARTVKQYGPSIIQEFIKGKTYSSSALFNSNGQPRRICIQQGLRESPPTGGTQIYTISTRQPEILECTIELLKALKWYGIAELDFILDDRDQRPKLLEINPRLYSSVCLPIAAGVDYPYLLYRLATEGDVEPDFNYNYELGIKCRYIFPAEFKYVLEVLRNKNNHHSKNPGAGRAILDFIKLYESNINYFVMAPDDPMPALVNLLNFVNGIIYRKLKKI